MKNEGLRCGKIPKFKKVGRPKKWQTVEDLEEQIQSYFSSCFVEKMERVKSFDEETGKEKWIDRVVKDSEGNSVYVQIRPFTVTGLAVALNTSRDVLLDYENKPENAEFSDTIKKAKQIIHNYAEEFLFSGNNVVGAIFNLKNNWGYTDKTQQELSGPDGGPIQLQGVDISIRE